MMKQCCRCGIEKPLEKFVKDKREKYGVSSCCLECHNAQNNEWKLFNLEKVVSGIKKWRDSHPEKIQEYNHAYRSENPEKVSEYTHNRYARKKNAIGSFTDQEWIQLKEYYNFTCLRCGKKEPEIKLTRDHVLPLELGGQNTIDNIQPLCKSCNSRKYTKHIDYRNQAPS